MVSRQSGLASGHATPSNSSSIKPTGWIRSSSKPTPTVLGDRTNLPSGSRSTPTPSLQKTSALSISSSPRKAKQTPVAAKQQKLSSFFAPHTAPAKRLKHTEVLDSPSAARAQRSAVAGPSKLRHVPALEDQDLEARAANLLKGRFGSVSRSLNTPTSSTPRAASPPPLPKSAPGDETRAQPARIPPLIQTSRPQQQRKVTPPPTPPPPPPRKTVVQKQPPSSPVGETLPDESLSNFTPPAWEKGLDAKMAMFQRWAGLPKEVILEAEKKRMQQQVDKAHRRMQGSPTRTPKGKRSKTHAAASSNASPLRNGKGLQGGSSASRLGNVEALLRSPTTKRRIYALETQISGGPMLGRATNLQALPNSRLLFGEPRRATSEARQPRAMQVEAATGEEESETQPLPWAEAEAEQETQPLVWSDKGDKTQPLAWNEEQEAPSSIKNGKGGTKAEMIVPTSDDQDLLLEALSSSSSASSSPSPSPQKRRRISPPPPPLLNSSSPRPQRPAAKVNPITLTPTPGSTSRGKLDNLVAALRREERKQHSGMQLSLNSFVASSKAHPATAAEREEEEERRKQGLSMDLDDELSDDQDERDGDVTAKHEIEDETQPLDWDSSPTQIEPPYPHPLQHRAEASPSTQRTSSSSSTSSISLPSQTSLAAQLDTQVRTFWDRL